MCIKDLRERFARIDIHVSPPLVAFRESVFLPSEQPDVISKPTKVGASAGSEPPNRPEVGIRASELCLLQDFLASGRI